MLNLNQKKYLSLLGNRLVAKLLASPLLVDIRKAIIEVLLDSRLQLAELVNILLVHVNDGQARGLLLVHHLSQSRLALDDGVGDSLALAEGRQPNNQLNGFDIVRDQNKLGFLLLNQSSDVVQSKLDHIWGALVGSLLAARLGSSDGLQAVLLGLLVLRAVLVQKGEDTARWGINTFNTEKKETKLLFQYRWSCRGRWRTGSKPGGP